jgi:DNA-binding beta-propeller fold protein YncE
MSSEGKLQKLSLAFLSLLMVTASIFLFTRGTSGVKASTTQHYLYVMPDQSINVYDMDNGFSLVKTISLPQLQGGRGMVVDPASASMYISFNGDGGAHGNGSMLKYNLLTDKVVWTVNYNFGIDSMAITPDGKTIYMPDGERSYDGTWHILRTSDGSVTGSIFIGTGAAAHNTVVGLNGKHAYLAALNYDYLVQVDTSNNQITKRIGPMQDGVRPFTINGTETLAFTTATCCLGFQVSSITTGQVLYTVKVNGFSAPAGSDPSHGISLSPDEKEVYVMDAVNSYVHVFDVSGLPNKAPVQVADIPLQQMTGQESPCLYDCNREGWVLHSGDGHYVFAGDAGNVIDTTTRQTVINLNTVFNTRKFLEVDWSNGAPIFTTSRYGLGYVTGSGGPTPTPSPTMSPSPTQTMQLAQDTFQRPDQTHWGTASDGQTWGGQANTNSVFSIKSNTGQISNTAGTYSATLGPAATDAEVLFSGAISTLNSSNTTGALLRWTNTNNFYRAMIDGNHLVIQKRVNGTYTVLTSVAFAATGATSYSLRFRVVGTSLFAKVWATANTEPPNWMATTTDSSLASGQCGLRVFMQTGTIATFTSFLATTA